MITGIDSNLYKDYVSKYDGSEPKTVWKLGVLSARAFSLVSSKITDQTKMIESMIDVVRYGLRGFENFKNDKGETIIYKTNSDGKLDDEILNKIPVDLVIELGGKILEMSKLTEQEVKN